MGARTREGIQSLAGWLDLPLQICRYAQISRGSLGKGTQRQGCRHTLRGNRSSLEYFESLGLGGGCA